VPVIDTFDSDATPKKISPPKSMADVDLTVLMWQARNVKPADLRQVQLWADQVRHARNVLTISCSRHDE
jgi:hypothetical protein